MYTWHLRTAKLFTTQQGVMEQIESDIPLGMLNGVERLTVQTEEVQLYWPSEQWPVPHTWFSNY